MAIILRNTKGLPLTHEELDGNFTDLNTRIGTLESTADSDNQTLTLIGDTLSISGGNSVDLSKYTDTVFSGDYDDLTNKPTIPADVGDLTDTGSLLGSDIGDITFTGSTISAPDDTSITVQALDSNSTLRSRIRLTPDLGAVSMRGYSSEDSRTFDTFDWSSANWITSSGGGSLVLVGAATVNDFLNNELNYAINIRFSINGGTPESLESYGYTTGTQTLSINTASAPDTDPTAVTEVVFFYTFSSSIGVDYDDGNVLLSARGDMNIRLESDLDINLIAGDDVRIEGADSFRLINNSTTAPIRIITDDNDSSYTWEFRADGTLKVAASSLSGSGVILSPDNGDIGIYGSTVNKIEDGNDVDIFGGLNQGTGNAGGVGIFGGVSSGGTGGNISIVAGQGSVANGRIDIGTLVSSAINIGSATSTTSITGSFNLTGLFDYGVATADQIVSGDMWIHNSSYTDGGIRIVANTNSLQLDSLGGVVVIGSNATQTIISGDVDFSNSGTIDFTGTTITGLPATDYGDITNTPTIPADVGDLTDTGNLLFSGDYGDLTGKPSNGGVAYQFGYSAHNAVGTSPFGEFTVNSVPMIISVTATANVQGARIEISGITTSTSAGTGLITVERRLNSGSWLTWSSFIVDGALDHFNHSFIDFYDTAVTSNDVSAGDTVEYRLSNATADNSNYPGSTAGTVEFELFLGFQFTATEIPVSFGLTQPGV